MTDKTPTPFCPRVERTLREMMHDRGYTIADEFLGRPFAPPSVSAPSMAAAKAGAGTLVVFAPPEPTVGVDAMRAVCTYMRAHSVRHAIVVALVSVTSHAVAAAAIDAAGERRVEIFLAPRLRFNVLQHCDQPRFTVLSTPERDAMMKRHGVASTASLMRMYDTDPVACYLGLLPGQVVRVERPHATVGHTIAFRVVVPDPRSK